MSNAIEQLKAIFDLHENDRSRFPLNGFGRGWEMGEKVLKDCPTWFQKWYESMNWHYVFLASGWNGFVSAAEAFGMNEENLFISLNAAQKIFK